MADEEGDDQGSLAGLRHRTGAVRGASFSAVTGAATSAVLQENQNATKAGDLFFNGSSETPEEVGFCAVLNEDIPRLYLNSFR